FLLGKDNTVKSLDLGQITSSMAPSLSDLVINQLVKDDEITASVGPNKLNRLWPPALTEWSTKAVRDAFFASPALPRLLDPNSIKRTIADGVTTKLFGYASRDAAGKLKLDRFGESLLEQEVEISDDLFILRAQDAERLLEPPRLEKLILQPSSIDVGPGEHVTFKLSGLDQYGQGYPVESAVWSAPDCTMSSEGRFKASDTPGSYRVTVQVESLQAEANVRVKPPVTTTYTASGGEQSQAGEEHPSDYGEKKIQWSGTIPFRDWMKFYTKVITKLTSSPRLTLHVSLEAPAEGESASAKIEDIKSALRELGLDENVKQS
ncbi:MAG TPA: AAA family ATPase, partial [Candidatus Competibacteraceae bacterium]|nr:AAA family ATPase [Candidatus Competibacteraceae bacterium]